MGDPSGQDTQCSAPPLSPSDPSDQALRWSRGEKAISLPRCTITNCQHLSGLADSIRLLKLQLGGKGGQDIFPSSCSFLQVKTPSILREVIAREFDMDMYTTLYLKWMTIKDLMYSTWNSAQCYVAAWMGGVFGGEWIHVWLGLGYMYLVDTYVWLRPFTVHLKPSQHRSLAIPHYKIKC